MMRAPHKIIIGVLLVALIASGLLFFRKTLSFPKTRSTDVLSATARLTLGVGELDGTSFNEAYVDSHLKQGMLVRDVEGMLGKPYMVVPLMGTQRASYRITPVPTGTRPLSGFTVVYESGKVKHVDKSFGGP